MTRTDRKLMLEKIKEMRTKAFERWNITSRFGGDWNAGYTEGMNYVIGLIDDLIRQEEYRDRDAETLDALHRYNKKEKVNN
jgi:hypothetical protein